MSSQREKHIVVGVDYGRELCLVGYDAFFGLVAVGLPFLSNPFQLHCRLARHLDKSWVQPDFL